MNILFSSFPWVGVLVATVVLFFFGALWFGPIYGQKWMIAVGKTKQDEENEKAELPKKMISEVLLSFVVIYMLSIVLSWGNPQSLGQALHMGLIVWLGFMATRVFGRNLWEGMSRDLLMINLGHGLIGILLASGILYWLG